MCRCRVDLSCSGYYRCWIWRPESDPGNGILLQYGAKGNAGPFLHRRDRPGDPFGYYLPGDKYTGKAEGRFPDKRAITFQTNRGKRKFPMAGQHAWDTAENASGYPNINSMWPGRWFLWIFLRSSGSESKFSDPDRTKSYGRWWEKDLSWIT